VFRRRSPRSRLVKVLLSLSKPYPNFVFGSPSLTCKSPLFFASPLLISFLEDHLFSLSRALNSGWFASPPRWLGPLSNRSSLFRGHGYRSHPSLNFLLWNLLADALFPLYLSCRLRFNRKVRVRHFLPQPCSSPGAPLSSNGYLYSLTTILIFVYVPLMPPQR